MRRLFAYILKNNFTFLFLLLETFSFFLVVQNHYQRAVFFNTANNFTGSILASYHNITEYFTLRKANMQLANENARLREKLDQSFRITDTVTYYQKDSLFSYIAAKVIQNSVNKQNNYLLIDKGKDHGIREDMGVITSDGVVGTVVEVSEHYARVISVLHLQYKLNARVKKNNHLGSIEWDGKDYRIGILTDIPVHVHLQKGDTIVTSGNSLVFPEGLLIGTVEEYLQEKNEKFNYAKVRFSVDYNRLNHVYVIENLMKEEQTELTEKPD